MWNNSVHSKTTIKNEVVLIAIVKIKVLMTGLTAIYKKNGGKMMRSSVRGIVTAAKISSRLVKLDFKSNGPKIIVNYWAPGYYKTSTQGKIFHKTESLLDAGLEVSIDLLKDRNMLEVMHPGHTSIETYYESEKGSGIYLSTYVSIGTNDLAGIKSIQSMGNVTSSKNFRSDCLGLQRFPELRVPFFSLDEEKSHAASLDLLNNQKEYSLLGEANDKKGINCSTGVYFCLAAAGINKFVTADSSFLGLIAALTGTRLMMPETLAAFVKKAGAFERENADNETVYKKFESQSDAERKKIEEDINKVKQMEQEALNSELNKEKESKETLERENEDDNKPNGNKPIKPIK